MKINTFKRLTSGASFLALAILGLSAAASAQVTPINQIQGDSDISPFAGKQVMTRGIVTALVAKGFYIQTPDAEADKNPQTSEGVYVFTNDNKADVAPGTLVEVAGTVTEYQARQEKYALKLTEITRPTVKVISKDNPLPAPIVLTAADLDPKGKVDQMEHFEGMRVQINDLLVVAPTGGYTDRNTGDTNSDGVFFCVIAGAARPFREPGIDTLAALIEKLPATVPTFDMNPELMRIDSDAQIGAKPIDVTSGATLKNIVGVVDYTYRAYTILPDAATPPVVEGNKTFIAASPAGEREVTVASFNIENFFDDEINSPEIKDETKLSTEQFQKRLNKASLAIRKVLSSPDVLAVIEVENLKVLKKLADKINADAVAENQPNPNYVAYLEDGNDIRGIDVGFLVKSSKVKVAEALQLAKAEKLNAGTPEESVLFDRPPFLLRAEVVDAKTNQPFAFTVIANHLKSYLGIDDEKEGDRVRQKRRLEAEWIAKYVADRAKTNPTERMIVVGDFNSFQFNDGYNDLIGILKGKSDPNVIAPSTAMYQTDLIDLVDNIEEKNRYSYSFGGSAQVLDHILINKPARDRALKFGYARLDADFPRAYSNDATRPERLSDHDAAVFYMSLDEKKGQ